MLLAEVPTALFNHSRVIYMLESIVLYHLATTPVPILCVCVTALLSYVGWVAKRQVPVSLPRATSS